MVLKIFIKQIKKNVLFLLVNCWPSENGDGGCDVNIEYELEHIELELNNVQISIPLPSGCNPVVGECDGQYSHEARRNTLLWTLPLVDSSMKTGSMEFSAPHSNPSDFFPLRVTFSSKMPYAKIKVNFFSLSCVLFLIIFLNLTENYIFILIFRLLRYFKLKMIVQLNFHLKMYFLLRITKWFNHKKHCHFHTTIYIALFSINTKLKENKDLKEENKVF